MKRRPDGTDWFDIEPGEFAYRNPPEEGAKWLHFWPLNCPTPLSVPISPQKGENGATWTLSGNFDAPTLRPSVNAEGVWHGHLEDGRTRLA